MNKKEAFEILRDTPIDIRSTREDDIHTLYATAQKMALDALEKVQEYEKLERTGKMIRMPDCRRCKHAYRDDTRCYECLANMTCWPNNFEPRKKAKK
jgi:predicted Zn-ribbon and HTH transcriptional regulator